ncbi:MAG: prephenate dehydrogenase [Eubacteriales bacterium]|jgi:prephenate dehydrogenase
MKINNRMKILIVGLGLIGGSYAMALKKKGYYVSAITRSQSTIDYALDKGIIDKGSAEVTPSLVKEADVVVFALYPNVFIKWIEENQSYFKSGAIITDVTGVKCGVVYKIQEILRNDVEFISAHPMAGKEVYGIKNADDAIFRQANYIVVPTERNTQEAIEFCESLGAELGFRKISVLSPKEHDKMIAFLSQLTHCIAVALMNASDNPRLSDYTGDSFRDLTRIAKINENMWSELFLLNKDALLDEIDAFMLKMTTLRNFLAEGNAEGMKEMMRTSTTRREQFDKK